MFEDSMLDSIIRKYALQNAVKFNGKANPGAVIGKIIGENPDLKKDIDKIKSIVEKTIKEINKIPADEQLEQLKKIAPELLEKKEIEEFIVGLNKKIANRSEGVMF